VVNGVNLSRVLKELSYERINPTGSNREKDLFDTRTEGYAGQKVSGTLWYGNKGVESICEKEY
jgi:hypothetical protein